MPQISIDAVVFDFDGVLVESLSLKGEAFAALYESSGPEIQDKVLAYHQAHGGVSRYDKIRYFEEHLLGRKAVIQIVNALADRFSDIVEKKVIACPFVNGAQSFLKKYHEKLPLFVNSATPEDELLRIVEQRGMNKFFRGVYGSPSSKTDNLNTILEFYNYKPARVIMVGDAMSDYEAARNTGTKFIGRVPPGEKSPFPSDVLTIEDLTHLSDFLRM